MTNIPLLIQGFSTIQTVVFSFRFLPFRMFPNAMRTVRKDGAASQVATTAQSCAFLRAGVTGDSGRHSCWGEERSA